MLWTLSSIFWSFFLHSRVETKKEQPILRGKEVEGKLLIGYTEHSCVLLFPPKFHLSEVQSTVIGRQHLKLILTVNTGDRIYRGAVTFQSHPSGFLCTLSSLYSAGAVIQIINHHICENDRGCVSTECLKEAASDPKYLHRQRSSVTFTLICFIHSPWLQRGEEERRCWESDRVSNQRQRCLISLIIIQMRLICFPTPAPSFSVKQFTAQGFVSYPALCWIAVEWSPSS